MQASGLKPQTFRIHFRSVNSKKYRKDNKALPACLEVDQSCASLWLCQARKNQRGRTGAMLGLLLAACRGLCTTRQPPNCENHTTVSAAERAQLLWPLKTELGTFTSAFLPLIPDTERTHVDLRLYNT